MKHTIWIVDVTNRDGVQTSRLGLSKLQKTMLNYYLNELGVAFSEFGFPTTNHETNYLNANLELVQQGVVGKIAGFIVFESNNMDFESTTRVDSKKTTTEFICGHPNWCHRVQEWQVAVHLQDLSGSGKYIGASAVQGRKVYGIKVSKPKTLYIKRVEVNAT